MSHTPGPWHIFDETDPFPGIEASDPRQSIVIWGTRDAECGVSGRTRKEQLANARLIASAPELLEALELIQGFNWALDDTPHGHEIKRRALAAIAKATA